MIDQEKDSAQRPASEKQKRVAFFSILTAAVLWATIGIFGRALTAIGLVPLQIVFLRAFGAVLLLGAYIYMKDAKLFSIRPKDSIYFIGTGIVSFVFFNWCYFIAVNHVSLSIAAILLYTAPAIVMLFSVILFGEKFTTKKGFSLATTFLGCLLVTGVIGVGLKSLSVIGVLAGLGAGLGYALYSVFGRYALNKYKPLTVTFYTFLFASVSLIPFIDFQFLLQVLPESLPYAGALSLFGTVLPFMLYTSGLVYIETGKASIIATLEPIVASVIGLIIFNESLSLMKIIGIGIVVIAVSILKD